MLTDVKDFFHRPFKGSSEMDALDWFMFVGILIVIVILWNIILYHVKEAF